MFWGLNLKPNRKYSQTASKNFHISGASIEDGDVSKVYVTSGDQKFLICTLENQGCKQVFLDLNFAEGEELCFQTVGTGNVTLSGYIVNEFASDDEDEDDEGDLSDSELLKQLAKSAKVNKKTKKSAEGDDDEDEEEEVDSGDDNGVGDDSELEIDEEMEVEDDDKDEEDDDDEEEEEEEEEEDDSDDEVQQPKAKQAKLDKNQAKQNGVAKKSEVAEASNKKSKKDKKAAAKKEKQEQQKQQPHQLGGERTITGGVKIEDVRVGNGPEAKSGKRALVYYEGRLKSNNKVFDSLKQGSGFKFAIGRGEVIKGWDVGVAGMKVGGKRRITCPPHMGYGPRGSPPAIPPNSTLVFEVELKGVN